MNLSPKQIVTELDKYIIGQEKAKKAVAIALRNRYRRSQLPKEMRDEITPKNIIMQGPTGVGKTEIARRLAKLVKAPFVKVEATKFTEVGYVGRDCESMIRDLVDVSIRLVKEEKMQQVGEKARAIVVNKIVEAMLPIRRQAKPETPDDVLRNEIREDVEAGKCDNEIIELNIAEQMKPIGIMPGGMGADIDFGNVLGSIFPQQRRKKKVTVAKAMEILMAEESDKLIDNDSLHSEAIRRAEQEGIIFIDEIDKIAGKGPSKGPDVSREGVQRDILPLVEGSTVTTKFGVIKTDYILFIAAGAFHVSKVEDLIPEFQGRFPIRVELQNLNKDDFYKILTQPKNALTLQYEQLLSVDNIKLKFTPDALKKISEIAERENETSENLGARRLHNILEFVLEDISYNANGDHPVMDVLIDDKYVEKALQDTTKKYDLSKYVI